VNALTVKSTDIERRSPCARCTVRVSNFCGALNLGRASLRQSHESIRARRTVYRAGDETEDVHVICEGWAVRSVPLSDGRRQILSFLLPGDLVSVTALFKSRQMFSVQALTDTRYCRFSRLELQKELNAQSPVFAELACICIAEKDQGDLALASLGQRSAASRIARLIILLMERLSERGMTHDHAFEFPLRQQHIADAVGLTTVHVSRVINLFRKAELIDIAERQMKIVKPYELQLVADAK
jgi:CRP/FNR family transcriptional regulator